MSILDDGGALEERDGLLVELRLKVVRAEPLDHVHVGREVAVRVVVVLRGRSLVALREMQLRQPLQHRRVGREQTYQLHVPTSTIDSTLVTQNSIVC